MKTTGAYKIWRIIYPIGIYYVVSSLAYFFLTLLLGAGEESYMLRQMLCAAATIPFVWMHYGQDPRCAGDCLWQARHQTGRKVFLHCGRLTACGSISWHGCQQRDCHDAAH